MSRARRLAVIERGDLFSIGILLVVLLVTVLGRQVAPYDPLTPIPGGRLLPPDASHLLGTDQNGTDILSRTLSAPWTDVSVALIATFLSVAIGAPLGALVGFFEGGARKGPSLVSQGVLRLLDVLQAFPVFVLAMVLVAIRGASLVNIIGAIAFVNVPVFVRIVRAEVLSLRERPYAEAARVVGNSDSSIAFRHLLPNALGPVLVQVSVTLGFSILLTASLSFVGAGVPPPTPEFGGMISSGAPFIVSGKWWPSMFPGVALGLTVFAFGVAGQVVGRKLQPSASGGGSEGLEGTRERTVQNSPGSPPVGRDKPRRGLTPAFAFSSHTHDGRDFEDEAILSVSGVTIEARTANGTRTLLDDVSFSIRPGEVLGVVGESGSGKSVLARAILQLVTEGTRVVNGEILFKGRDLTAMSTGELRLLRGASIAPILPDAKAQLNPVLRVGSFIEAAILAHSQLDRSEAHAKAIDSLKHVGISDPDRCLRAYPHELSGGMAQRVCIAIALLHDPLLVVADEPTFGLDVTVQRQVLDLMAALVTERHAAQLIVTRDLGIVAHYCQNVAVMKGGRIIEAQTTTDLFASPIEPYTRRLVEATRAGRVAVASSGAEFA